MTQKNKDAIILTILPKMVERYLPEHSIYTMLHECYRIISDLEEEGYFPEPPTYRITSSYELDYPNLQIGTPNPNYLNKITCNTSTKE